MAATASATETFHGDPTNGNNFTSLVNGALTPTSASIFTWDSADAGSSGMLSDVQNWLDNPTTNDGWLLRAMSGIESNGTVIPDLEAPPVPPGQSFLGFWTRDGAMANNNLAIAPMLTVTYTPEPAIGTLALLAAPFVLPRRRRSQA